MEKLIKLIKELIENKFYGSLEIKMEAGNIVVIKKTESIKFPIKQSKEEEEIMGKTPRLPNFGRY